MLNLLGLKTSFSRRRKDSGFTLVELLVVIAIIVLLTGIIMANLASTKGKAKDAKRVSDLGQIQLALELFFDRCKEYPTALLTTDTANGACPGTITLGSFISQIPAPPPSSDPWMDEYYYFPNSDRTDYYLLIGLEGSNPALQDDFDGQIPWGGGPICTDPLYCISSH